MSCSLIQGGEISCRDSVGGVKNIYIANFTNVQTYSASSGVISSITMVPGTRFYTFQVEKENAQYDNKGISSVENGTSYFESTLTFTLKKMSASQKNSMKTLLQSRLVVIVEDNNDVKYVMGVSRGADCTEANMSTGKAFGDLNGSSVTIVGKEPDFDNTYTGSISTITS